MLQFIRSHLSVPGRRMILPTRDIFDADLDRARRKPGCVLCRLVQEHDERVMKSFLWEYCTDPHIGAEISKHWGFCPYHGWSLALLEHEWLGDGLGISIVYQALLRQLQSYLNEQRMAKRVSAFSLPVGPAIGERSCGFCQKAQREEAQFLARLVSRFRPLMHTNDDTDWSSVQTELCFPHMRCLLQACSAQPTKPSLLRYMLFLARTSPLPSQLPPQSALITVLSHYSLQSNSGSERNIRVTQDDWSRVARKLALLVGNRQVLFTRSNHSYDQPRSRQFLLVTGKRSRLRSPRSSLCPVCTTEVSSWQVRCLQAFEKGQLVTASMLCQNHHWLLAATIIMQQSLQPTDRLVHYETWLEQQLEEQQLSLKRFPEDKAEQHCIACTFLEEICRKQIASIIQHLRQEDSDVPTGETLLCLFHWKQAHDACMREPGASSLQRRLLALQRPHLAHLDELVEAYIASFNAARPERGEVPDLSGTTWAWERLLAFFSGEPALEWTEESESNGNS